MELFEFKTHEYYDNKYLVDFSDLNTVKPEGLSVFVRIREEGWLVKSCIESIIDFADEIIVVYCPSQDNTETEILKLYSKYPSKIKYYKYEPEVFPPRTLEHFITDPNSPHSSVNFSNYALSKTNFRYVLKHDADHLNLMSFSHVAKALKMKNTVFRNFSFIALLGAFKIYFKSNEIFNIDKLKLNKFIRKSFNQYYSTIITYLYKDKFLIGLSGINIGYVTKNDTYLFDSFPTVGHGDYGVCRRENIRFSWSSNYEDVETPDCRYAAFTFYHIRINKRFGPWNIYSKYTPFNDITGKLLFPEKLNNIEENKQKYRHFLEAKYINIPKNNFKIKMSELDKDWFGIHLKLKKEKIANLNYRIFWGIDQYEDVDQFEIIRKLRNESDSNYTNF